MNSSPLDGCYRVIFMVLLLINWLVNVAETVTGILKEYF